MRSLDARFPDVASATRNDGNSECLLQLHSEKRITIGHARFLYAGATRNHGDSEIQRSLQVQTAESILRGRTKIFFEECRK